MRNMILGNGVPSEHSSGSQVPDKSSSSAAVLSQAEGIQQSPGQTTMPLSPVETPGRRKRPSQVERRAGLSDKLDLCNVGFGPSNPQGPPHSPKHHHDQRNWRGSGRGHVQNVSFDMGDKPLGSPGRFGGHQQHHHSHAPSQSGDQHWQGKNLAGSREEWIPPHLRNVPSQHHIHHHERSPPTHFGPPQVGGFSRPTPQHHRQLFDHRLPQRSPTKQASYLEALKSAQLHQFEMDPNELKIKERMRFLLQKIVQNVINDFENIQNPQFDQHSVRLECFGSVASGFATQGSEDASVKGLWSQTTYPDQSTNHQVL